MLSYVDTCTVVCCVNVHELYEVCMKWLKDSEEMQKNVPITLFLLNEYCIKILYFYMKTTQL